LTAGTAIKLRIKAFELNFVKAAGLHPELEINLAAA